ncbi:hypothetical protein ACJZ2D_008346 [Fusarium nematophilum]
MARCVIASDNSTAAERDSLLEMGDAHDISQLNLALCQPANCVTAGASLRHLDPGFLIRGIVANRPFSPHPHARLGFEASAEQLAPSKLQRSMSPACP